MDVLIAILFFGGLGYFFYRGNWGWWNQNRRFPKDREDEPTMDAFTGEERKDQ